MLGLLRRFQNPSPHLLSSKLYDEQTFYPAFLRDLNQCRELCILESPFITHKRMNALYPSFRRLTKRGVRVVINTRDPREHEYRMAAEAEEAISALQDLDVLVLYTNNHHRKLAILDNCILYEGSLNILSQNDSCEVMRRIESVELTRQMIQFVKLNRFL
jgi:hypothetical protein